MNLSILKELVVSNFVDNANNEEERNSYQTCAFDFECINEIRISNLVKNQFNTVVRPFHFNIVNSHQFIMLKDLNLNIISSPIKYVLLEYNLDLSKYQPLSHYLSTVEYPSAFLSTMLDIYSKIISDLLELEKMDICFFHVSANDILVDQNSNAILSDFKKSLFLESEEEDYFMKVVQNIKSHTYKPIEIHLIHYLLKVNDAPLSYSSIDEISIYFAENMDFLNHFGQEYKTKYYHDCVRHLKSKYLNKPKDYILNEIRRESLKTWDNFALSILFLHIFKNTIEVFSLNHTIINDLVLMLKQNLDPVPTERHTLSYTLNALGDLLLKHQDWASLRLIPKSKMKTLYERMVH
jgi:hypothetical protein